MPADSRPLFSPLARAAFYAIRVKNKVQYLMILKDYFIFL
jgi:hypothetical protein